MVVYWLVLVATALERCAELIVARRNAAWSLARGGREYGASHYPAMVILHTALFAGCIAEPLLRSAQPSMAWVLAMAGVLACTQALRWWCIRSLGKQWNTRVIIVEGLKPVAAGPYKWLRHPNYVAVAIEGLALPLAGGAWLTAAVFTLCNAALMMVRLRTENRALATLSKV